ncbi:MAG: type II toxin-antitoxin system HicB family antitoxin [Candidatus Eiseniibacteriota bacterium]
MEHLVRINTEGGGFVAQCDDFPGCAGRGRSREEALESIRAAIVYSLEICPCAHNAADGLRLTVVS